MQASAVGGPSDRRRPVLRSNRTVAERRACPD